MTNTYIYGIIIICILVLCILINAISKNDIYSDLLTGYWKSDTDFLEKNNISFFSMAIGPCTGSSRNVYMVMKDANNNTILNEDNIMIIKTSIFQSHNIFFRKKIYDISFDHDIGDDVIPSKLNMIFEPVTGFLTMYDEDIVYAEMYKDNELSDLEQSD